MKLVTCANRQAAQGSRRRGLLQRVSQSTDRSSSLWPAESPCPSDRGKVNGPATTSAKHPQDCLHGGQLAPGEQAVSSRRTAFIAPPP